MTKEQERKSDPQERQSVVDKIRAGRAAEAKLEKSRAEALEALPALREQVYAFVRRRVTPYSVSESYASYIKQRKHDRDYLVEPGEEWDPDEIEIPGVEIALNIPVAESEQPTRMFIDISAYPDTHEPTIGAGLPGIQIEIEGFPHYVITGEKVMAIDTQERTLLQRYDEISTIEENVIRPLEMDDVVAIRQLIELAEEMGEVTVQAPYQAAS